jgi:NAD(P)-dependent dehydrogenase (short-subunit alcohol dehydrogenase family)
VDRRVVVVTGVASGIGAATARLLADEGCNVIGVDRHSADVVADLSAPGGRSAMVDALSRSAAAVDGVIACAGSNGTDAEDVSVNYFGAVATLDGLRPMLARGRQPRAVAVGSIAMLEHPRLDDAVVTACLELDEDRARVLAERNPKCGYASAKLALARWVRRVSTTSAWAGEGIAINTISPATIKTPMTQGALGDPVRNAALEGRFPMPLHGRGDPEDVARVLAWFVSPELRLVTGQCVFVDGGADVARRGDDVW